MFLAIFSKGDNFNDYLFSSQCNETFPKGLCFKSLPLLRRESKLKMAELLSLNKYPFTFMQNQYYRDTIAVVTISSLDLFQTTILKVLIFTLVQII